FVSVQQNAQEAGARVGVLYALNTFGAATGPLLSAFVLLPSVGLGVTKLVACSMNFGLAAVTWLARKPLLAGSWKPGEALRFWPEKEAAEGAPQVADEPGSEGSRIGTTALSEVPESTEE